MKRFMATLLLVVLLLAVSVPANVALMEDTAVSALAIDKLALREYPNNQSRDLGTYDMRGRYVDLVARSWDSRNSIWWVEVYIWDNGRWINGWTGLKRFDSSSFDLYWLPEINY